MSYIYICIYKCIYIYIYIYVYIHIYTYAHTYIYISHVCICLHIYIYTHICMCTFMYIYIYISYIYVLMHIFLKAYYRQILYGHCRHSVAFTESQYAITVQTKQRKLEPDGHRIGRYDQHSSQTMRARASTVCLASALPCRRT